MLDKRIKVRVASTYPVKGNTNFREWSKYDTLQVNKKNGKENAAIKLLKFLILSTFFFFFLKIVMYVLRIDLNQHLTFPIDFKACVIATSLPNAFMEEFRPIITQPIGANEGHDIQDEAQTGAGEPEKVATHLL